MREVKFLAPAREFRGYVNRALGPLGREP